MSRLNRSNHKYQLYKMFRYALYIEDLENNNKLERFSVNNVTIQYDTFDDESEEYSYTLYYPSNNAFLRKNAREYSICLVEVA